MAPEPSHAYPAWHTATTREGFTFFVAGFFAEHLEPESYSNGSDTTTTPTKRTATTNTKATTRTKPSPTHSRASIMGFLMGQIVEVKGSRTSICILASLGDQGLGEYGCRVVVG